MFNSYTEDFFFRRADLIFYRFLNFNQRQKHTISNFIIESLIVLVRELSWLQQLLIFLGLLVFNHLISHKTKVTDYGEKQ